MCYTITDEFKNKVNATLMETELFKKIIDEIAGNVNAIRLSLRGEPTLHPDFFECIRYSKEKGIKEISFLTNGSTLNKENIERLIDLGVDWITVSVDGTYETYEKIRFPLKFEDTLNALRMIKYKKDQRSKKKPVIKIQSVWPAIKNNPEEYYNLFRDCTDLIAFNPLIDYLGNDDELEYEEGFSCPQLYQRMTIGADGKAMMCSNDEENFIVLGDINLETVYSVWHGAILAAVREKHKEHDGFLTYEVCKRCYLPRKTEDFETFCLNGEEYRIKNYVKRSQEIGK